MGGARPSVDHSPKMWLGLMGENVVRWIVHDHEDGKLFEGSKFKKKKRLGHWTSDIVGGSESHQTRVLEVNLSLEVKLNAREVMCCFC